MKRSFNPTSEEKRAVAIRVNSMRDKLEVSPIEVNGHLIDVDEKSDSRLRETIELAPLAGVTSQLWTLADNTEVSFTIEELSNLYQSMRIQRMIRAAQLHAKAREFKLNGCTNQDLSDWEAAYTI